MASARPAEVAIIGGGIGGLALALALQQAGQSVVVYERAPELREIGAGILLTPNASWVLGRLGLLPEVSRDGRVLRAWQILSDQGRVLQTFGVGGAEAPSISIERSALQRLLAAALSPGTLQLGKEVISFTSPPEGTDSVIYFADASRSAALVVVLANGGRSRLKRQFFRGARRREHRYIGWRALVGQVPAGWEEGLVSESWARGCRFGIAPVGGERTYWYSTENVPEGWTPPPRPWKPALQQRFARWHAPIRELIDATAEEELLLTEIADAPPVRPAARGSVALLGDAAHLMTPNLGQGAAMALEDAWELSRCLLEHGLGARALALYSQRRYGRVAAVSWLSRQVGRMIQLENPLLWRLRNAGLRATPDWLGSLTLAPVFNFRI